MFDRVLVTGADGLLALILLSNCLQRDLKLGPFVYTILLAPMVGLTP